MKSFLNALKYPILFVSLNLTGGCEVNETGYLPLQQGQRWEYLITTKLNNEVRKGKSIIASQKPLKIDNVIYFPHIHVNGETEYLSKTSEGVIRSKDKDQQGEWVIKYPLEQGTEWKTATRIAVLDSRHESFSGGESFISLDEAILLEFRIVDINETIKSKVGIYPNGLRVEGKAIVPVVERTRGIEKIVIEQTDWYAPGVGLIKTVRTERSLPEKYYGEMSMELINFQSQ